MIRDCLWTDWNQEKLARGDVTREEFEAAIASPLLEVDSDSSGRPAVFARVGGRLLFCVYVEIDASTILPWTAYEVPEHGEPRGESKSERRGEQRRRQRRRGGSG